MTKRVKKRFDIDAEEEKTVSKSFDLDKNILSIKGVLITSDKDDMLYFRGTQRLEINKEEFFPENYETKLLMSGVNVSPNHRYYDLGSVEPGNRVVKVDFTDHADSRIGFENYRVSIYLDCEMED